VTSSSGFSTAGPLLQAPDREQIVWTHPSAAMAVTSPGSFLAFSCRRALASQSRAVRSEEPENSSWRWVEPSGGDAAKATAVTLRSGESRTDLRPVAQVNHYRAATRAAPGTAQGLFGSRQLSASGLQHRSAEAPSPGEAPATDTCAASRKQCKCLSPAEHRCAGCSVLPNHAPMQRSKCLARIMRCFAGREQHLPLWPVRHEVTRLATASNKTTEL